MSSACRACGSATCTEHQKGLGVAVNEGIFATSMRGLCFRQHEVLFSSSVGVDDIWCDVNEREFLFFFWQFLCSPSACGLRSISLLL
jgi:hypothetical protein